MNTPIKKIAILIALLLPTSLALAFTDVNSSNTHKEAIDYLRTKNVIQGYTDNTFRPNSFINRAEFLKILLETKFPGTALTQNQSNCFPDITTTWYSPYVCYAKSNGIITGYPDGNFHPENNINLAEALKMVLKTYEVEVNTSAYSQWYEPYYWAAKPQGWLNKINLDVNHLITRGEMAQLIFAIEGSPTPIPQPIPAPNPPLSNEDLNMCTTEHCHFLIFISPQYANDQTILTATHNYMLGVKTSLGWNTRVIQLDNQTNQMDWIDQTIEQVYNNNPLIASLMIGEDTKTPVYLDGTDGTGGQEQPMPATWADVNENITAYTCPNGECMKDYTPEVAISFLYPTTPLTYETKKEKIIFALNKFATQKTNYGEDIQILMSKEMSVQPGNYGIGFSGGYGKLYLSGNLDLIVNPTQNAITESLSKIWKIFGAEGHATSSYTVINDDALWPNSPKKYTENFYAPDIKNLNTALYMSNGCVTGGWVPDTSNGSAGNGVLDPPYEEGWWGSYVLENPFLRTEINSGQASDFTHCAAELINKGLTMAEVFNSCNKSVHGIVMFGDPTLRFTPYTPQAVPSLEIWGQDILDLPQTPSIGQTVTERFSIRNTGDIGTSAIIHVYDATNFDDLFLTPSIYNDPNLIIQRPDLQLCEYNTNMPANSNQNFECEWTTTKEGINTIMIWAENTGSPELNTWDNWQRAIHYVKS